MSKKSSKFAAQLNLTHMKRTISLILLCACACVYSLPAFSWGQEGHRIIAKIAYDHLNKKAKKQVDAVLGTRGIIYWANWPDEIKSDTIYKQSIKDGWHFQDFNGGMTDSAVVAALTDYPKEGGNLFRALDSLVNRLQNTDRSQLSLTEYRAQTDHVLRFIVHLSGDRYCPMHVAHMDDRGGNDVKMQWFGRNTRLHTVWDTNLIESQGYSYTEYAQMIEDSFGWERSFIEQMTDAELLVRTYHLTSDIYAYQQTWDGNTYHYIYRWHRPMEEQLYIAGIRLAQLLNSIYQ